jgi:lysozyme family protein
MIKKKKKIKKAGPPTLKKKQSNIPSSMEYIELFNTCTINKEKIAQVDKIIDEKVVINRARYEGISRLVGLGTTSILATSNQSLFQSSYIPFYNRFQPNPATAGQQTDAGGSSLSTFIGNDPLKAADLDRSGFNNPFSFGGNTGSAYNNLFNNDIFGGSTYFKGISVPWYFIACVHYMECSFSFSKHLHNGDPLTGYTVHVPAHRPKVGHGPPFTFEESAVDAIKLMKYDQVTNWSLPLILQKLEGYNGFGYNKKGVHTPYLWSFSNHYTKGKYVKDGVFDANAVSQQMGTAVILKRMEERAVIYIPRN